MEVIISTAFGYKVSILRGTDDKVIDAAMDFFETYKTSSRIIVLAAVLRNFSQSCLHYIPFIIIHLPTDKIPLMHYLLSKLIRQTAAAKAYGFLMDAAMAMVQTRRQMKGTLEVQKHDIWRVKRIIHLQ